MRARNLKPGFFKNEALAECSFASRLLYEGLWLLSDKEGRLEDRRKRIKAEVFPYDDVDMDILISELYEHGFVKLYEIDGARYMWIPTFSRNQYISKDEKESVLPEYSKEFDRTFKELSNNLQGSFKEPLKSDESYFPYTDNLNTDNLNAVSSRARAREAKENEGSADLPYQEEPTQDIEPNPSETKPLRKSTKKPKPPKEPDPPPEPPNKEESAILGVLSKATGYNYDYDRDLALVRELTQELPHIDILAEVRAMAAWLSDNPPKGKPNSRLFLRNWMTNPKFERKLRSDNETDDLDPRFMRKMQSGDYLYFPNATLEDMVEMERREALDKERAQLMTEMRNSREPPDPVRMARIKEIQRLIVGN